MKELCHDIPNEIAVLQSGRAERPVGKADREPGRSAMPSSSINGLPTILTRSPGPRRFSRSTCTNIPITSITVRKRRHMSTLSCRTSTGQALCSACPTNQRAPLEECAHATSDYVRSSRCYTELTRPGGWNNLLVVLFTDNQLRPLPRLRQGALLAAARRGVRE